MTNNNYDSSVLRRIVYCPNCNELVEAKYKSESETDVINNVEITYPIITCSCSSCGSECSYLELAENNSNSRFLEYRKALGIISLEKVRELPEKYDIGKRPLSRVLGWGEITFTRFFHGDIPSKEYSDIMTEIYDSPLKFRSIVERNRECLTDSAYEKCSSAIDRAVAASVEDQTMLAAAYYIYVSLPEISNTALQKLLYYTQGFYAGFIRENCFLSSCYAWERGPVYPEIYKLFKDGVLPSAVQGQQGETLSPQLKVFVDEIINSFGCYSGDLLTRFTHSERPWLNYRKKDDNSVLIPFESISEYFHDIVKKRNMQSIAEIRMYAQEMFAMASSQNMGGIISAKTGI